MGWAEEKLGDTGNLREASYIVSTVLTADRQGARRRLHLGHVSGEVGGGKGAELIDCPLIISTRDICARYPPA